MRFSEYVAMARAHWAGLTAFTAIGILLAALAGLLATPEYQARAELVVVTDTGNSANDLAQGSDYSQKQVRTFSALASRPIVLDPVIKDLGLETTAAELARHVGVSTILNTNVISISVTDADPQLAASIANGVSSSLTETIATLVPSLPSGDKSVRMQSIRDATVPVVPSSPNIKMWIVLGALAGLAIGACLIALREALDSKLRTSDDAERITQAPLLGTITLDRRSRTAIVPTSSSSGSPRAEEYRQIRTNIAFLEVGGDRRLFAITSSVPGEGKSTTAANLAASLAAAGHSVCLVEADLRRPSLGKSLGLEGAVGLTTVLIGRATVSDVLQQYGPDGLQVLLSGRRPPNPSELLSSPRMRALLDELSSTFEYVVIDCPPVLPVTDAAIIGNLCGGAILVAGVGIVERRDLAAARAALAAADSPLLGVVANRVRDSAGSRYGYSYEADPEPEAVSPVADVEEPSAVGAPAPPADESGTEPAETPVEAPGDALEPQPAVDGEGDVAAPTTATQRDAPPRPRRAPQEDRVDDESDDADADVEDFARPQLRAVPGKS
ncbi:polysaccharide biosynthesis tyrosine autokinase [Cellulomonas sp. PhB150]|uniref:polysaccharide biosynthesis tyrosine autokinase n=1 Tax=Cellulomonas sp. PhB150 TaxID=2485188 RepID=UPI000F47256B|nr:polysaccharide biosynthesis tyrosine autokinase [Cellulomonas sp. PhB150]ROS22976.1 capsular exopolysaccharide synthesis family protein [Cellulomonas sp. PhB150]